MHCIQKDYKQLTIKKKDKQPMDDSVAIINGMHEQWWGMQVGSLVDEDIP